MRATRVAITVFFFADGLLVGSWASRIPAVQRQADLTNSELGLALFAAALGALTAMPLAGVLSERIGSRLVTVASLVAGGVSFLLASLAGGPAGLAAALFAFGGALGALNVSGNAQGLALERLYGRSILSSFHAAFSGGGLVGAGHGALAAGMDVAPRVHFAVLVLALTPVALAAGRRLLPADADDPGSRQTLAWPSRALLVLGAAAFFTLLAEGAAIDWSVVYLSQSAGAGAAVAALGYAGFSLAMATSRMVGDRLNGRFGPVALARGGGVVAGLGLAFALVSGSTAAGLVGFAAMGAGLGVVVPVLFRAAGTTPGVSASAGVAAVSTLGWLGFLSGPPAIGVAADAVGLRTALVIVVLAIAGLVLLGHSACPRPRLGLSGLGSEARAVISDLDGVLVDSGVQIEGTWRAFAERNDLELEQLLALSHGRRAVDLIQLVVPHLDAGAEAARIDREQIAAAASLTPLPGARELVESVPASRFAIVTSGSRALAVARLQAAGIPVPEVLVTAEQVERGKPDPAGYLRAARLLGVDPGDAVVLEDAPAGVEAGRAAGMTVVAVLTTSDESALRDAHRRVPDLRSLLPGGLCLGPLPADGAAASQTPARRSAMRSKNVPQPCSARSYSWAESWPRCSKRISVRPSPRSVRTTVTNS
jgi:HAD superfamily hydrolase (TIGR01509 family)